MSEGSELNTAIHNNLERSDTWNDSLIQKNKDLEGLGYQDFGVLSVGAIKELKEATDTAMSQQEKLIEKLTKRMENLEEQLKR